MSIRLFTLKLGRIGVRQNQIPIPDGFSAVPSPGLVVQSRKLFYALTKLAEILFSRAPLPISLDSLEISMTVVDIEFELDHECDGCMDGKELLHILGTFLKENPEIENFPVKFNNEIGSMCMRSVSSLEISDEECIELF